MFNSGWFCLQYIRIVNSKEWGLLLGEESQTHSALSPDSDAQKQRRDRCAYGKPSLPGPYFLERRQRRVPVPGDLKNKFCAL